MRKLLFILAMSFLFTCCKVQSVENNEANCQQQVKTELYFGLSIGQDRQISEADFQTFIDENFVRQGIGLTILDGQGRWLSHATEQIEKENSKVVVLMYELCDKRIQDNIQKSIQNYNQRFSQQSVLRIDFPVTYQFVEDK